MKAIGRFAMFCLSLLLWILAAAFVVKAIRVPQLTTFFLAGFGIVVATLASPALVSRVCEWLPKHAALVCRLRIAVFVLVLVSGAGAATFLHLITTDMARALFIKAKVQKYIGQRDVSAEILWLTADEVSKVQKITDAIKSKDPSLCRPNETEITCFERTLDAELKNGNWSPTGQILFVASGVSIIMKDHGIGQEPQSVDVRKKKSLNLVSTLIKLASNIDGSVGALEKKVVDTFGPIPEGQKFVLKTAIEEPMRGFKEKITENILRMMSDINRIKTDDPEVQILYVKVHDQLRAFAPPGKVLSPPPSNEREPANK